MDYDWMQRSEKSEAFFICPAALRVSEAEGVKNSTSYFFLRLPRKHDSIAGLG